MARLKGLTSNLNTLIGDRLKKLSPEQAQLLSYASVFGGHFWEQGLRALGLEFPKETIDGLVAEDLIFSTETSRFLATREYAFRNILLRDMVYESIAAPEHKVLHQRAAEWLVGVGEYDPIVLANHYQKADLLNEAREALCIAASAALHSGDPQGALVFIQEGLAGPSFENQSRAKFELLTLRRKAFELQGHYELAIETVAELTKLSETGHQRSKSEFDRSRLLIARGNSSEALRCSRQALEQIENSTTDASHGWLELALGDALQARGDTITACTNYQNSYSRAKEDQDRRLSTASILRLARIAYSTSDFTQAIKLYDKARLRYIQDLEDPGGEALAELGLGATLTMIGEHDKAADRLSQAHAIFSALPDSGNRLLVQTYQLFLQEEETEQGATLEHIQNLQREIEDVDYRQPSLFCGILLLRKYLKTHALEDAVAEANRLFKTAIRSLPRYVIAIESAMGVALAKSNGLQAGLQHTEAAVARLESQKAIEDDDPHRIYLNYSQALALTGNTEMSHTVLRQAHKTMTDIQSRLSEDHRVMFRRRSLNRQIDALVKKI